MLLLNVCGHVYCGLGEHDASGWPCCIFACVMWARRRTCLEILKPRIFYPIHWGSSYGEFTGHCNLCQLASFIFTASAGRSVPSMFNRCWPVWLQHWLQVYFYTIFECPEILECFQLLLGLVHGCAAHHTEKPIFLSIVKNNCAIFYSSSGWWEIPSLPLSAEGMTSPLRRRVLGLVALPPEDYVYLRMSVSPSGTSGNLNLPTA